MEVNFTNSTCVQFAASFVTYQATLWTFIVISTILLICGIFIVQYLLCKQLCFDFGPWHGKYSLFPPQRITPAEEIGENSSLHGLKETSVFTLVENNLVIANECRELSITRDNISYEPCPSKENILLYSFDESIEITNREVIFVANSAD